MTKKQNNKEKIEYEEETPEVEVDMKDDKSDKEEVKEEQKEESEVKEKKPGKKLKDIEKIITDKLRGRIIIFDADKSEFAKNLELEKEGDYVQKK